jgi:hypothetical protein
MKGGTRFNDAVELTVPLNPKSPPLSRGRYCCIKCGTKSGLFQLLLLIVTNLLANSVDAIIYGLGFLTRDPSAYECFNEQEDSWRICAKEEICEKQLGPDRYRPVKDDEYLDNWQSPDKFNTLCESKYKIGLLGSI